MEPLGFALAVSGALLIFAGLAYIYHTQKGNEPHDIDDY